MINTKIGSRWHYINRAHLQIPLDPLLPTEQEFPRLSAYDRSYSGSYHVDLYYRSVSRWMMEHAVKAKRKWLKEDKTYADLQAEILAPVIQTFDSAQPVRVQIVWIGHKDVSRINSEGVGSGVRAKEFTSIPHSPSLFFPPLFNSFTQLFDSFKRTSLSNYLNA